ncbi:MAG: sialate O-acetylesterase [Bacillota bacterium]
MAAGGPYVLTVSDGETTLSFADILIGDVFFAGGQSNMEMRIKDTENGADYIAAADFPTIRFIIFPVQAFLDEETVANEHKTKWQTVKPGECGEISAVAYHFAVRLQSSVHVPVGIINCYLGGTSITCWLDEEALCATSGGKAYYEAYQERIKNQTDEQYLAVYHEQLRAHTIWSRKADAMLAKDPTVLWDDFIRELGPCPWPPPEGRKAMFRPCGLAETMLKRIAPYSITGFLYYQGESDVRHPHLYRSLMRSLIAFWRGLFWDLSLPFLFVQLAMFTQGEEPVKDSWAVIRQCQEQACRELRNTGLAVMIDGGEKYDIHPKDKKTVGERLYLQAMQVIYHQDMNGDSPRAVAARPEENTMIVNVSAPLQHVKTPRLFEVAGEDGVFYPAEAEILGSVIRVASAKAVRPSSVRYAWVNYGLVNVFGENGLPLAPFILR